jgi:hypothetical protein
LAITRKASSDANNWRFSAAGRPIAVQGYLLSRAVAGEQVPGVRAGMQAIMEEMIVSTGAPTRHDATVSLFDAQRKHRQSARTQR